MALHVCGNLNHITGLSKGNNSIVLETVEQIGSHIMLSELKFADNAIAVALAIAKKPQSVPSCWF